MIKTQTFYFTQSKFHHRLRMHVYYVRYNHQSIRALKTINTDADFWGMICRFVSVNDKVICNFLEGSLLFHMWLAYAYG